MKAFSKEWWLNIATTVIRDFELCSFDNGIPHITFRQTYDWDDEDLDLFTNYCFKRYAEAYHREKMMFTKNEMVQLLDASEATQIERERILEIIEEEMNNKVLDYEKELNWFEDEYDSSTDDEDLIASEKKCAELDGQIKLSKLLIEKIKG